MAVDAAFKGAGRDLGLEAWRIEVSGVAVEYPKPVLQLALSKAS